MPFEQQKTKRGQSPTGLGAGPGFGCWVTQALCRWELIGRREDCAAWLCWHAGDVRTGLGARRNVCFKASFLTLIKTTKARLASSPAEPKSCNLAPRGKKPSKTWQWTGAKRHPEELAALAEPEGTTARWHRAGTGPAALPCPLPALQLCPRAAPRLPLSAEPRAGCYLIWKDVRCLLEARCSLSDARASTVPGERRGGWCVLPSPAPGLPPPSLHKHGFYPGLLADVKLKGSIFWLFRCRKVVMTPKWESSWWLLVADPFPVPFRLNGCCRASSRDGAQPDPGSPIPSLCHQHRSSCV